MSLNYQFGDKLARLVIIQLGCPADRIPPAGAVLLHHRPTNYQAQSISHLACRTADHLLCVDE
jgi:hypothetical protein